MYPLFRQIDDIYRDFLSCTTIYSYDKKILLTKYSHCVRIVSAREGQSFPKNTEINFLKIDPVQKPSPLGARFPPSGGSLFRKIDFSANKWKRRKIG